MDKDEPILRTPSWLLPFIFDCFTQGVCPVKDMSVIQLISTDRGVPFDSALLTTALPTHEFTHFPPKHIIVNIFSLVDRHISNDGGELIFFFL
jgi:hypothetical protein